MASVFYPTPSRCLLIKISDKEKLIIQFISFSDEDFVNIKILENDSLVKELMVPISEWNQLEKFINAERLEF